MVIKLNNVAYVDLYVRNQCSIMSFEKSVILKMLVLFALGMFISSVSTKAVGERQKGDNHIKVNECMIMTA